ncbi:MAG: NADH-quinone oxidoreductase subunit H [Candidatus Omnitrophica bacterium]|nr:NADH-quinone oxidoreductase subunit H [Candidatus Omnitrophota bacterium]MCM8777382.1 NADH-quinone oxidoreductase subunit H [Candidatus Omnitrophota bacterium]
MSAIYIFLSFVMVFLSFSICGMLAMWMDRKVTARLQFRVGPPWYQNFADFIKLTGKETLIPEKANTFMFIAAPVLGLIATTIAGTIILLILKNQVSFSTDAILILYLLTIPSLSIILGGSASGNVLAAVGISREMKLLLGYELPFICTLVISAIKSGTTTSLGSIIQFQQQNGMILGSFSGVIGFIIGVLSLQGKLGLVPFDLAEAEGELAGGSLIEYSGILLGLFKLTKAILLIAGPLLLISLYLGGFSISSITGVITGILKYILILVLFILIKNTNPRLRIDQTLKLFWGWLTLLGFAGILLAIAGW